MSDLSGMFYWPRNDFSTPADNLCWHVPPSPNGDYRCVRPIGHPGKHGYAWAPVIKDHSHKAMRPLPPAPSEDK